MMPSVSHIENVKRRIRGLLAIAADDSQFDGEVANAMELAERAMEAYHLERADVEADGAGETPTDEPMGETLAACTGARLSTWESTLYRAVSSLVGSVKAYATQTDSPVGAFQRATRKAAVMWYGPADDARLAAELFEEWSHTIATLAVGKYRGCMRGDGARYAYGFASALQEHAKRQARQRDNVFTDSTRAIVKRENGSLAMILASKRARAETWLATVKKINLGASSRRAGYSWSPSGAGAFQAGKSDGARAKFSSRRQARLAKDGGPC